MVTNLVQRVEEKTIKQIMRQRRNFKEKKFSPAGNRTPVSRVTGGDTHHYTTEELGWKVMVVMSAKPFGARLAET